MVLKGEMDWSERTSEGTKKGREEPIDLERSYKTNWRDYSIIEEDKHGKFRYLVVEVPRLKA